MEFDNQSSYENHSIFPNLEDQNSPSLKMDFERIDSSLFNESNKEFNLDQFFNTRQSHFLEKECNRLNQSFRSQYRHFQHKFSQLKMTEIDKSIKSPNFKKSASIIALKNFEGLFSSVFATKADLSIEEFINNFYHKSFEFSLQHISSLCDFLFHSIYEDKQDHFESPNGGPKKTPWSNQEENELLKVISDNYPLPVPADFITNFCQKHNRTRSSLNNKIHKMKRKFENNFRLKNVDIFSQFVEVQSNQGIEHSVMNVIQSENQATYDLILKKLKIQPSQIEEQNNVNKILYDLLDSNKIRCDEKMFIELSETSSLYSTGGHSPIMKTVLEILNKKENQSIALEDLRNILVHEFQIIDKKGEELDSHLVDFLLKSKMLVAKNRRVFY